MTEQVTLRAVGLHWLGDPPDHPSDLCAHGGVDFRLGDDVLGDGDSGNDLSLSTAALHLLRTLERPHTKRHRVGEHLFPHCGFAMHDVEGSDDVLIIGCVSGLDFEVDHRPDASGVSIRSDDGREWPVAWPEWRAAVFSFADQVSSFFAASSAKRPSAEHAAGYRRFLSEWERRRGEPIVGSVR